MAKKGEIINRIGEIGYNFYGRKMVIIDMVNNKDITVEFDDGRIVKTRYSEFKSGKIKHPYDKRVYGVGYHGEGEYKVSINQIHTFQYNLWYDMLKRCYCKNYIEEHPTYKDCTVCEEWHNFQNFAKWVDENYYEVEGNYRMELEKDILVKGNKIYSPETCVFIPRILNTLFIYQKTRKGKYPLGVAKSSNNNFYARVSKNKNGEFIREESSKFPTPEEAFYAYKEIKEKYIKEMADEYKDKIPQKLYDAMYRYEVEITD